MKLLKINKFRCLNYSEYFRKCENFSQYSEKQIFEKVGTSEKLLHKGKYGVFHIC
jgi:hypothetical protein